MRNIKLLYRFLTLFLLLSTLFAFFNKQALAAGNKMIRVTPIMFEVNLKPGQESTYKMDVENLLPSPLGLSLNLQALNASDEDNGITFDPLPENSPLIKWIKLPEKDFLFSENSKKTIEFTISIPRNVKEGSYNSVLFLTPMYSKMINKNLPTVLSRLGALIFVNIGIPQETAAQNKAKIVDFYFGGILDTGKEQKMTLRVQNIFPFTLSTKANIEIDSFSGKRTLELIDKRILASKIRRWQQAVNLPIGFYKATAAVSVGGGQQIFKSTYFMVFPLKIITEILVLVIILYLIYRFRKRIKKAAFILYKGS